MAGGYRSIIIALVGWLVLTAASPPSLATSQTQANDKYGEAQALQDIASALKNAQETAQDNQPCRIGETDRKSDLCAQWKAADAASASAWWAWVAGVATIVSTGAVLVAIGLAYQANSIARATARRQLRAYVCVAKCTISDRDGNFVITVIWKNTGQTPAYKVRLSGTAYAAGYPFDKHPLQTLSSEGPGFTLGPNGEVSRKYEVVSSDRIEAEKRMTSGVMHIFLQGTCDYLDAFEYAQFAKVRYEYGGFEVIHSASELHPTTEGNDAT